MTVRTAMIFSGLFGGDVDPLELTAVGAGLTMIVKDISIVNHGLGTELIQIGVGENEAPLVWLVSENVAAGGTFHWIGYAVLVQPMRLWGQSVTGNSMAHISGAILLGVAPVHA